MPSGSGGATDLDGLSDVSIVSPVQNDVFGYNGGLWRNNNPSNIKLVTSLIAGATGADQIFNMISLTQAEYDAIGSKTATTLYVISP